MIMVVDCRLVVDTVHLKVNEFKIVLGHNSVRSEFRGQNSSRQKNERTLKNPYLIVILVN